MLKLIAVCLLAVSIIATATIPAYAADKTHDGVIVSVAAGKLVMTDNDGKNERGHDIDGAAKITLDGKDAKLAELKAGDRVRVTQDMEGKVISVAATRRGAGAFAANR
jgi:hypothetical protein